MTRRVWFSKQEIDVFLLPFRTTLSQQRSGLSRYALV